MACPSLVERLGSRTDYVDGLVHGLIACCVHLGSLGPHQKCQRAVAHILDFHLPKFVRLHQMLELEGQAIFRGPLTMDEIDQAEA